MKKRETNFAVSVGRRAGAAAIATVLAAGMCAAAVPAAFADQTSPTGDNGVQEQRTNAAGDQYVDYQAFDSAKPASSAWGDSNNEMDGTKDYSWGGDGKVHLFYDTTGGNWYEPGPNHTADDDNVEHENGTYVVTIPTTIAYTGMSAGKVSTSDKYEVNVRGLIAGDKKVTLSAETNKSVSNAALGNNYVNDIKETTSQTKTVWTAAECYGTVDADNDGNGDGGTETTDVNPDGSLMGTSTTDTIAMTGTARASGEYTGTVAYAAKLG